MSALRISRGVSLTDPALLRTHDALVTDRINAIVCQQRCTALPDPSGNGLGMSAEEAPR
jgi:hypothetical protein